MNSIMKEKYFEDRQTWDILLTALSSEYWYVFELVKPYMITLTLLLFFISMVLFHGCG